MPESSYRADNSNHEDGESILQESRKSYFEIQVAEIPHRPSSLHNCDPNPSPTVTTSNTQKPHVPELSGFPKHPVPELATQHTNNLHPIHEQELQQIEITLDPEEYTAYTWATEEELASGSVGWGVEDGGGGGLGMKMSGSNGLGMREGVAVEDRDVCLGVLRGKGMVGVRGK